MSSFEQYSADQNVDEWKANVTRIRGNDVVKWRNIERKATAALIGTTADNPATVFYLESPDGTIWAIEATNAGTLTVTAV